MLACWLVFPLVLGLLAWGCGLLIECVGRTRLEAGLVIPLGFAVIVVLTTAVSVVTGLRPLAIILVVGLAVAGFVGRRGGLRPRSPWLAGTVLVVFLCYGAPVLFSGQATFAGFTRLQDASTFLALTARLIDRGRDLSGLAPSTYLRTLQAYLQTGYPVGSLTPLGTVQPLVGQNLAWLFQPYLTLLASFLAMCLWALASPLVQRPALRGAAVVLAAQPALLYAYANEQGAVKEMTMAVLVALAAALAGPLTRAAVAWGLLLAGAITGAALLDTYSLGSLPWLGPLGLAVGLGWARGAAGAPLRRMLALAGLGGAALAAILALPTLATLGSFASSAGDLRASSADLGNLVHPLSVVQLFGVWPTGDFRTGIGGDAGPAGAVIAAMAAMAVLGLGYAWRQRAVGLVLYGAVGIVAFLIVRGIGSAWVTAKAMAVTSPAIVLLAAAGVLWWARQGARVLPVLVAGAIGVGVLWSNALAYQGVALAPRDRLAELAQIGRDFKGQGPALLNEYESYGARLFLRTLDAEAPAELRERPVARRDGSILQKGQAAEIDQFALASLGPYRTIVLRRSPAESRPPATFALKRVYRYYEVWQQPVNPPALLTDLPLRRGVDPAGVPDCRQVAGLAGVARAQHAQLVGAPSTPLVVSELGTSSHPASWSMPGDAQHLTPSSPGTARLVVGIARAGLYTVWLGGSFARGVSLSVDGRPLGAVRYELNFGGEFNAFGRVALAAGAHAVALRYPGADLHPGSAQQPLPLGPLILQAAGVPRGALVSVVPARAATLCGRPLDWIEVVRRSPGDGGSAPMQGPSRSWTAHI